MDTFWAVRDLRLDQLQKRDLLLFDKVMIVFADRYFNRTTDPAHRAELEWLRSEGLIEFVDAFALAKENRDPQQENYFRVGGLLTHVRYLLLQLREKYDIGDVDWAILDEFPNWFLGSGLRLISGGIEKHSGVRSTPILATSKVVLTDTPPQEELRRILLFLESLPEALRNEPYGALERNVPEGLSNVPLILLTEAMLESVIASESRPNPFSSVLQVVISDIPVPDTVVTWEQIVDFRQDESVHLDRLALRRWMRSVANENRSAVEVAEELEYLKEQYRRHMQVHRMKQGTGMLETLLTTTADVVENIARFKPSSAVKAALSLRNRKAALLEAEQSAPGKEVAFVVKTQTRFS